MKLNGVVVEIMQNFVVVKFINAFQYLLIVL